MFQAINKITGQIVREAIAYAQLEAEFADSWDHEILNTDTGARWDVGYQSDAEHSQAAM